MKPMRKLSLKLRHVVLLVFTLSSFAAFADDASASATTASDTAAMPVLPLSAAQVNKLNHLFHVSVVDDQAYANAVDVPHQHIVWNQTPIDVILPVGKERMLTFPDSVAFGYDKSVLTADKLQIQNNNGTLYLTAKTAFDTQRVAVKDKTNGKIILLNLSAQQDADTTPIDVVFNDNSNVSSTNTAATKDTNGNIANDITDDVSSPVDNPNNTINFVSLTRFAAQQLYAPERLLTQPGNIFRVPMHTYKTVPLLRDGSAIAMPLASWRGGDYTITAVLLRNNLHQTLALDPRVLCGNWQAATFFPNTQLAPAGQLQDSTTAFLIANQSFATALHECLAGV